MVDGDDDDDETVAPFLVIAQIFMFMWLNGLRACEQ